jgi:hypothetical protein
MLATNRTRFGAIRLFALHVAIAACATSAYAHAGELNGARNGAAASPPMTGVATGETVNGLPVYRLPSISVTVDRQVELAKIVKEDAIARADRARASAATGKRAAHSAPVTLVSHATTN